MTDEFEKYRPMDEPKGRSTGSFWGRRHGSCAPIASRLFRKLMGLEFELQFADAAVLRGEDVELNLTVSKRRGRLGEIDVGLVCVESYDVQTTTYVNKRSQTTRTTRRATAHEQWIRLDGPATERAVSFEVPENAPYSYDGDALSFAWQIRAVSRATGRPDAAEHWEVAVLP
jgi:hypothetical protein